MPAEEKEYLEVEREYFDLDKLQVLAFDKYRTFHWTATIEFVTRYFVAYMLFFSAYTRLGGTPYSLRIQLAVLLAVYLLAEGFLYFQRVKRIRWMRRNLQDELIR